MARTRQRGNGAGTLFQREGRGAWIAKWYDHNGQRQERSTKTPDKRAAERILAKWCGDAQLRREGVIDARAEGLSQQARRLIGEHLDEFKTALLAKGSVVRHVELTVSRVRKMLDGASVGTWADASGSRAMEYLRTLRADTEIRDAAGEVVKVQRGISAQTFNFYLQAVKQFGRWMVKDRRAADNPFAYLEPLNVRVDRRRDRRALTTGELLTLIRTTSTEPERYGMSGPERALLYRVAAETGLRANEIRSLTRGSFLLDGDSPTVTVAAAYSKRRREDTLLLRPSLANDLSEHLQAKTPSATAFNMPAKREESAAMFRADRDAAGIMARDDAGRVVDFHALRHTFLSNLAAGGVHPKTAQALARHSTITLTMDRYTHRRTGDEAAALDVLPDLSVAAAALQVEATGTDGKPTEMPRSDPPRGQVSRAGRDEKTIPSPSTYPTSSPTSSRAKGCASGASRCDEEREQSAIGPKAATTVNLDGEAVSCDAMRSDATEERRGRDSNPRYRYNPYASLANRKNDAETPANPHISAGAPPVAPPVGGGNDPDLARLVDAWPALPPVIRAGILAMVDAATPKD